MAMSNLPREIFNEILVRLPAKPLGRFRCVSKYWHSFLTDPVFVKKHLSRATEDQRNHGFILHNRPIGSPPMKLFYSVSCEKLEDPVNLHLPITTTTGTNELTIVDSCNGIVCLIPLNYPHSGSLVYLWNPVTREYKAILLPQFKPVHSLHDYVKGSAFGFSSTINDYKVVRVLSYFKHSKKDVDVYSLNTNSWKRVEGAPHHSCVGMSVANNGSVHWLTSDRLNEFPSSIISFDMDHEVFQVVPLPDEFSSSRMNHFSYRGCLSMVVEISQVKLDVWVMKENGVKESWTKQFTIETENSIGIITRTIAFCRKDEVLLVPDKGDLVLYNLKSGKYRKVQSTVAHYFACGASYIQSLVSLDP